jgi:hypothetical protein
MAANVFLVVIRLVSPARQEAAERYLKNSFETLKLGEGIYAIDAHVPVTTVQQDLRDAASDDGPQDPADVLFLGTLTRPTTGVVPPGMAQWFDDRLPHVTGGPGWC